MTRPAPAPPHPPTEPLGPHHDRAAFSCGVEALDRYFRHHAGQDVAKRVAAAFIAPGRPAESGASPGTHPVLGYYTLAAASVLLQELPPGMIKRLPRYPHVPATLLGRLAVDVRARGRGYSERLLVDALRRSLQASGTVASGAVVVDAKDEGARRFYQRYDFLTLPGHPTRLFLPMRTVAALFGPAAGA